MIIPTLTGLTLDVDPEAWCRFGVGLDDTGRAEIGSLTLDVQLPGTGESAGLTGWTWSPPEVCPEVDPITNVAPRAPEAVGRDAEEGMLDAVAVDHVVLTCGDAGYVADALAMVGLYPRGHRETEHMAQSFFLVGPTVLEVVSPSGGGDAPPALWGLTFAVADLAAEALRLGEDLGPVRDAVQPGRRIAPVRRSAGLQTAVALITPRTTAR